MHVCAHVKCGGFPEREYCSSAMQCSSISSCSRSRRSAESEYTSSKALHVELLQAAAHSEVHAKICTKHTSCSCLKIFPRDA